MTLATESQIQEFLRDRSGWQAVGPAITKTYEFSTFADAMSFLNRVGKLAESANHHPDLDLRYRRVTVRLTTHTAGGITSRDLELADQIDRATSQAKSARD